MHIAWYSEDKPFAVGYADGKLLIGSKEPLEKGAIVVIDAHKVSQTCLLVQESFCPQKLCEADDPALFFRSRSPV